MPTSLATFPAQLPVLNARSRSRAPARSSSTPSHRASGGNTTDSRAIMLVVFGAFMLGDFLLMKMLGFALAVAVLLDATVMSLAVSPALLVLAGRWNWWPGERTDAHVRGTVRLV